MNPLQSDSPARCFALLSLSLALSAGGAYGEVETAGVYGEWGVWSGWFWPFNDAEPPNLYGSDEALSRFDLLAGAQSQSWERDHHGPVLGQPDWAGHCHAWAGASVWEAMPTTTRYCGDLAFRPRDLAALMTEAYYNDTAATEISAYRPSPGLLWRYLHQEILGENSIHGHPMALIGNLTAFRGQVWNFPIFEYKVDYTRDETGSCAGTVTLWFADDGIPSLADSLGLRTAFVVYPFKGVKLDAAGLPRDSGSWYGTDPSLYPTSIWRPYQPASWTTYVANPELDAEHLGWLLDRTPAAVSVTVATSSSPPPAGSTSGGGTFASGVSVTAYASPDPGYAFITWTENGEVISASTNYTFTATTNRTLVANFIALPPVLTVARIADHLVLTWSTNQPAYRLESCTAFGPAQRWSEVTSPPAVAGKSYSLASPLDGGCRFFRLRLP
jgi:hypothetical protein